MTSMRVGIVGTGEMGRPLIDRLLDAGHSVTSYARRPEVREELSVAGVVVVDEVNAIAVGSDVVIIYVFTDEQVRQVVLDDGVLAAMEPRSTLVLHTTGSPKTAIEIAEIAATRNVVVVDAPGTGGPANVANGTLTLFVGANQGALEHIQPLFACYADRVVHFGPVGSGQRMKLLNNLLFGAHVQFAVEVGRLCTAMELDEQLVLQTLHGSSGGSSVLDMASAAGSSSMLLELAGRFVHKDVAVARQLATEIGVDLGTLEVVTRNIFEFTSDRSET